MKLIKFVMPSQGDMEIVKQEGGTIILKPTYFGGECAGPIIQFIDQTDSGEAVETSYRIKIRKDNELKLAKAD